MSDKERPKNVPEGAWRNGHEWELGPKDDGGQFHGVVQWWRLDGTLACRTEYVHGTPHGSFQRFHPNGEVSREGTFDQGRIVGIETWHKSTAKTGEYFAVYSSGRKVWTAVTDHTKGIRTFLDKKGHPVDQKGKPIEAAPEPRGDGPAHWEAPPASPWAEVWERPRLDTELLDGVYFTPELRDVLPPRRDGVATPVRPAPDLQAAWDRLRALLWSSDAALLEHARAKDGSGARSGLWGLVRSREAEPRRFGARVLDPVARPSSEEEDVWFFGELVDNYGAVRTAPAFTRATYAAAVDATVAGAGLPEACYRLLLGLKSELPYQRMGPFERLRELLAIADDATYAAARQRIQEGLAEAQRRVKERSYAGRTPWHLQWAAMYLLPVGRTDDPVSAELNRTALQACQGRGFGNDPLNAGGLGGTDLAGLQRFRDANERLRHEFFAGGPTFYLAGILDQARGEAVNAIAAMKVGPPFEDSADYNGRWLFLLAHFDSDAIFPPMVHEHSLERPWGVQALALARRIQPERTDAWLAAHAPELVELVHAAEPLSVAGPAPVDPAAIEAPSAYEPPVVEHVATPTCRVDVTPTMVWRTEEAEELGRGRPPEWDDVGLRDLSDEAADAWLAHRQRWALPSTVEALNWAPDRHVDALFELGLDPADSYRWSLGGLLLRYRERALPIFRYLLDKDLASYLEFALPVGATAIAPPIVMGFAAKAQRVPCRAWITRHPRHAWAAALDMALPPEGARKVADRKASRAAERTLRYLASLGHRDGILGDAEALGHADAVRSMLDDDWLARPKAKRPKLPAFAKTAALPDLTRSGTSLDAAEVDALLERLAVSTPDDVYPTVREARSALDPVSAAAFAWALFEAWLATGADPKQVWAMHTVGLFGGDHEVRELARMAKDWPGNKASARAQLSLDTLLLAGTDTALVQIHLLAEKSKYPKFKQAAHQRIALLADRMGLTVEELQDRLVPRLGLDDDQRDGAVQLDFGPRHFLVRFDEQLRPQLFDADGKARRSLPKPNAADDKALAKAAKARLSGLKKDAKAIASILLARLERAMATQRPITADVFLEHIAGHPLVVHLARRLVWRTDEGIAFRVAEDGTLADADDEVFALPDDARVFVAHPLDLDESTRAAWSETFADYALLQPFDQLARATYRPNDGVLDGLEGATMPYGRLRGLARGTWSPWHDSWISTYERDVPGGSVRLHFEPGYDPAGTEVDDQKVDSIHLHGLEGWGDVPPIAYSEVVRELAAAREA